MSLVAGVQNLESNKAISAGINVNLGILGLVGTAGKGPLNTATFVTSNRIDGDNQFGNFNDDGFTIPKAREVAFKRYPCAMVIVNVCDPDTHTSDIVDEAATFGINGVAKTAKNFISSVSLGTAFTVKKTFNSSNEIDLVSGITSIDAIKSADGLTTYTVTTDYTIAGQTITRVPAGNIPANAEVLIEYTSTAIVTTDYTINAEDGQIQRTGTSTKIEPLSGFEVSYTYVDPTQVDAADIVAGISELLNAKALTGFTPRILLAPEYAGVKTGPGVIDSVAAALANVADDLRAIVEVNINESSIAGANVYRADFDNERVLVSYANHTITDSDGNQDPQYQDVARAAERVKVDAVRGIQFAVSNRVIDDATSIDRVIDYNGTATDTANLLAGNQINTVINNRGIRFWRQFTTSSNAARQDVNVRRIADYVIDRMEAALSQFIDEPLNQATIDLALFTANNILSEDTQGGILLGGEAVFGASNTEETLANGDLAIDYEFTPVRTTLKIKLTQIISNRFVEELLR